MPKRCICKYIRYINISFYRNYFSCCFNSLEICEWLSRSFSIIAVFEFQQFSTILAILHHTWTNGNSTSGMTWGLPRNYSTRCTPALHETYPQQPVHRGPSHLYSFTSQLLHRPALAREGNSLRLLKVGAQPQAQPPPGLPHLQ